MKGAIFSSVERELWWISGDIALEFELSEMRVLEILLDAQLRTHHYSRGENLFPDSRPENGCDINTLRVTCFTWYSMKRRCMFYAWVCVQCSQQSHLFPDYYPLSDNLQGGWLTIQWVFGNCSTAAAWRCVESCEVETVISTRQVPALYGEGARQWLNAAYLCRWIGCWRPFAWSPRSQDLTLIDIFLIGVTWRSTFMQSLLGSSRSSRGKCSSRCGKGCCQHIKTC